MISDPYLLYGSVEYNTAINGEIQEQNPHVVLLWFIIEFFVSTFYAWNVFDYHAALQLESMLPHSLILIL